MHQRDGMDLIKYNIQKIWKIIENNKRISIAAIVVLIILFGLIF